MATPNNSDKVRCLVEDIEAAAKLSEDLQLFPISCVLFGLMAAIKQGPEALLRLSSAVGAVSADELKRLRG